MTQGNELVIANKLRKRKTRGPAQGRDRLPDVGGKEHEIEVAVLAAGQA